MITVVNKEKETMECNGIWKDDDGSLIMLWSSGHSAVGYTSDCPLDFDGDEYFIEDKDDSAWWIHVSPKEGWEIM